MPHIRILPPDLRNKIAAGEVIERPASVVKELIENALDAESTDIRIDIQHGGKRLIRVSDNGAGMNKDDALLCFERHATSKLSGEDDLYAVKTLGFRGEALASIASVSKVRLVTAQKGHSLGVSVELRGGIVTEVRDAPAIGTTVEVKDLFFNTPARKKFMKKTATELYHIIEVVTRESLAQWETAFSLVTDNKETLNTPPSSHVKERIMQIYGEEFVNVLTRAHSQADRIQCTAYISKSGCFRNTKSHQYLFLNRRPIKDTSLSHAVYRAYDGFLPRDKHPIFFLYLDVDPSQVDVNVHPAKREVRFHDKEFVYRFVHDAIRASLTTEHRELVKQFSETTVKEAPNFDDADLRMMASCSPRSETAIAENLEFAYTTDMPYLYLGDTFIALASKAGLTVIDHHAAHERVLYEKLLKGILPAVQRLMFPRQVQLSRREYLLILEHAETLKDFGIEVEDFGFNTVLLRSLPEILRRADAHGILSDIASFFAEGTSPDTQIKETLAARIACHSSVRGREILGREELRALLADLEKTEYPDQCPHGRPTRIFFTLEELKKLFKRK